MHRDKWIAVVANQKGFAEILARGLRQYFEREASFCCYSSEEFSGLREVKEEAVVLSSFTIFSMVRKKLCENKKIIIVDLTLNREKLSRISEIPQNTRAYLVNIDYRNCMEVITMIYKAGYCGLDLIPYYPGCEWDPSISTAITPGEIALVPSAAEMIIDIGHRVVDRECIYKIATLLDVEDPFNSERGQKASQNILSFNTNFEKVLGENRKLSEQVRTLLKLMDRGIIVTDTAGKILLSNHKADIVLNMPAEALLGCEIYALVPKIPKCRGSESADGVVELNGKSVIVSVNPIVLDGKLRGNIIALDSFAEAERRQHAYRSKIVGEGHVAKYTFSDIRGDSVLIANAKENALRIARSDAAVYLHGETGTGKEVFAQAIHNASARKKFNFVAVNCSALPESLLESELYGYEAGAFSGAKKDGKMGLFELAHNGTLFLDEIGELSLSTQAKLLRAIEEKKILKVGGTDLINVDVRIIAATNRDLYQMVCDKLFREDLYYRLCVLPIELPSLRERPEDILDAIENFERELGASFILLPDATKCLKNYRWPGNMREVRNVVEYFAVLGKKSISIDDLPPQLVRGHGSAPKDTASQENAGVLPGIWVFILQQLQQRKSSNEKIGRQRLATIAKDMDLSYSEAEIKSAMAALQKRGWIVSGTGRAGSKITPAGEKEIG